MATLLITFFAYLIAIHPTYDTAIAAIESKKFEKVFTAITSNPCFEYWLLLHYQWTTKGFVTTGKKSACECLIVDLKKVFKDYEKNQKNVFSALVDKLDFAMTNGEKSLKHVADSGNENPSTKVHLLVDYLKNLRR